MRRAPLFALATYCRFARTRNGKTPHDSGSARAQNESSETALKIRIGKRDTSRKAITHVSHLARGY
jgi:hypothetical protein